MNDRKAAFRAELKRLLAGRTQEWLAAQCGVEQQAVSKWVRGVSVPEPDGVFRIEEALFGSATGALSRTLGYVKASLVDEPPPCTIKWALLADDIDEGLRGSLLHLVDNWPSS